MGEFLYDEEVPKPELAMFGLNQLSIPLAEYMRTAMVVSKQCGIRLEIEENEDRYRFDFYLHKSLIMGKYVIEWCSLISGSEMYTLTVHEGLPQTIRASFYRMKEENL